jgi:hypothetical protein
LVEKEYQELVPVFVYCPKSEKTLNIKAPYYANTSVKCVMVWIEQAVKDKFKTPSKIMKITKVEDNEHFFLSPSLHMHTVMRSSTSLRIKIVAKDAVDANPDKEIEKELSYIISGKTYQRVENSSALVEINRDEISEGY